MRYKLRLAPLLLSVLLLCSLGLAVSAHEVPDGNRKGTVTVKMEYDGKSVTGGVLAAYRVAQIVETDGNFGFEALAPYEAPELLPENLNTPELAASFAGQISGAGIAPASSENGLTRFEDLELGLYLIVQTEAAPGFEPMKPFLVSVPINEDGHYVYDVTAEVKSQLHQEPQPTTPPMPTQPLEPTLPQTGQLNWPIPVLAVLGLVLFSVGWALHFGKKKED